jgi:hypothetical protein
VGVNVQQQRPAWVLQQRLVPGALRLRYVTHCLNIVQQYKGHVGALDSATRASGLSPCVSLLLLVCLLLLLQRRLRGHRRLLRLFLLLMLVRHWGADQEDHILRWRPGCAAAVFLTQPVHLHM